MDRKQYDEAKTLLDKISIELESSNLTPDQIEALEHHKAALSGALLSTWLPIPWSRRTIMIAIVVFGLWQALQQNYQPLIFWLALPFFSPRIMGEAAFLAGKIARTFR